MTTITASSKYADLSQSYKLYYVLGVGGFLSILSFALYTNLFIALTTSVSAVVVYLVLSRKPEAMKVVCSDNGLLIDNNEFGWSDCISWAAVDLPEATEIILETTSLQQKYIYMYVQQNQAGVSEFLNELGASLPYQEAMPFKNVTHNLLRKAGLI